MKLISVVTPCFNEEENVEELYLRIKTVFEKMVGYDYEHIFADNASTDNTVCLVFVTIQILSFTGETRVMNT